jgi:hypothetical protein
MINAVQTKLSQPDGSFRFVIIEPVLQKDETGALRPTGIYKIYKDAAGDQTTLFTEPENLIETDNLPDAKNPDYLGNFRPGKDGTWLYNGDLLIDSEQAELAAFIRQNQGAGS